MSTSCSPARRRRPARGTVSDSLESAMLLLLSDAAIKSVTFRKGLTLDELISFLHALTKKFWDVKDGKEINKRLRDERGHGVDQLFQIRQQLRELGFPARQLLSNLEQLIDSAANEGMGSEA